MKNIIQEKEAGRALASARKKAGLTQQELADKLNITKSYISALEQGTRRVTLEMWEQITKVTGLKLESFSAKEADWRVRKEARKMITAARIWTAKKEEYLTRYGERGKEILNQALKEAGLPAEELL